jgi:molybdate transport system substrate-binding protein
VNAAPARLSAVALAAVAAAGCQSSPERVFAAAASSARFALPELVRAFEAEHPGRVVALYGASGTLAERVAGGAAIDVVLLGDRSFADDLVRAGRLVPDSLVRVAENRLVLVASERAQPAGIRLATLDRLPASQSVSIAQPGFSAAGRHSRALLETLGVWAAVRPRLRRRGDTAAALADVRHGQSATAIVYETDLAGVDDVAVIDRVDRPRPELWLAVTRHGGERDQARALARFVASPRARALFAAHGFRPPAP